MKKIKFLIFAAAIAVAMSACNEEKEPPEEVVDPTISEVDRNWVYGYQPYSHKSPNFIINYVNSKEFYVNFHPSSKYQPGLISALDADDANQQDPNWQIMSWNTDSLTILCYPDFDMQNAIISAGDIPPFIYANSQPELFNPIAKRNGDVTYNDNYWDENPYLINATKYINLTCDRDYDAEHPKGALLNDIVKIDYYTAKPFIDSKYKNRRLGDHDKSRTVELLRDFNTKQVGMLRYDLNFRLTTAPQTPGLYRFIFTYCDDTGSEISATTEQINLKARQ